MDTRPSPLKRKCILTFIHVSHDPAKLSCYCDVLWPDWPQRSGPTSMTLCSAQGLRWTFLNRKLSICCLLSASTYLFTKVCKLKKVDFDLTCDVIDCTDANEIGSHDSSSAGLSNTVWILKINLVFSEIAGGSNAPDRPKGHGYNINRILFNN